MTDKVKPSLEIRLYYIMEWREERLNRTVEHGGATAEAFRALALFENARIMANAIPDSHIGSPKLRLSMV